MQTTYHLNSAQEISSDILDAIKATYKTKSIAIIIKEDDSDDELTSEMQYILDERLLEDEESFISGEDSLKALNKKYGL